MILEKAFECCYCGEPISFLLDLSIEYQSGVEDCEVTIKGTGNGKEGAVKGISDAGIRVLKLIDQTGFPHNGCRQSKRKRN